MDRPCDRHWLLTSTFYGTWLPGDPRGFVSRVRDDRPGDPLVSACREHDMPGTPYDEDVPGLRRSSAELMKGDPVLLNVEQAERLADQFERTAEYRGWQLLAVAVMSNHVHLVVGVVGDPEPEKLLQDFKNLSGNGFVAELA